MLAICLPWTILEPGTSNGSLTKGPTDHLAASDVSQDDWVADVGAGAGYYSLRLSEAVGSAGQVFAEDISKEALEMAARRPTQARASRLLEAIVSGVMVGVQEIR